jgi:hypothetical protein
LATSWVSSGTPVTNVLTAHANWGSPVIRKVVIGALYTVANWLCLAADQVADMPDDIWRDRRWKQWDDTRRKRKIPMASGLMPLILNGVQVGVVNVEDLRLPEPVLVVPQGCHCPCIHCCNGSHNMCATHCS